MTQIKKSKRELCPGCDSANLNNYILVQPGEDAAVFVECAECSTFVARYTLRAYTCEDPYRSHLRLMRSRDMSSGAATKEKGERFAAELWEGYRKAKEITDPKEISHSVEDLLDQMD